MSEHRTTTRIDRGVTLTEITRGKPDKRDRWTVTVQLDGALLGDRDDATQTARRLRAAGLEGRVDKIDNPDYHGQPEGPLGWRVRVGHYDTREGAQSDSKRIKEAGFDPKVVWTGEDGEPSTGPWRVNVLTVDRHKIPGVRATCGTAIAKAEKTSTRSEADGGSTTMAANQRLIGQPSGATERRVGDAIEVLPR